MYFADKGNVLLYSKNAVPVFECIVAERKFTFCVFLILTPGEKSHEHFPVKTWQMYNVQIAETVILIEASEFES